MTKYYVVLLNKLKQQMVSEGRGKISNGILFLQGNAISHKAAIMDQKLAGLHSEVLQHLAHSCDVAPSDHYLFHNLKKHLKGRKILSTEETTLAPDGMFAAQSKELCLDALKKLEQQSHKHIVRETYIYIQLRGW